MSIDFLNLISFSHLVHLLNICLTAHFIYTDTFLHLLLFLRYKSGSRITIFTLQIIHLNFRIVVVSTISGQVDHSAQSLQHAPNISKAYHIIICKSTIWDNRWFMAHFAHLCYYWLDFREMTFWSSEFEKVFVMIRKNVPVGQFHKWKNTLNFVHLFT